VVEAHIRQPSGTPLEVRLAVGRDGRVYAVWRDARTNSIYLARSTDGVAFEPPQFVAAAVVVPARSCHTFRARIAAQPRRCVSPNPVVAVDDSGGPRSGTVYIVWGTTGLNGSQDVDIASFAPDIEPRLGVGRVQPVSPREEIKGPDQFLPAAAVDPASGRVWACYYSTIRAAARRARFTCSESDDGGRSWARSVPATARLSDESRRPANLANGYGDYEAVAVDAGALLATWTDGSRLRSRGEETAATRITVREVRR
jgi:hypothetical protein